MGVALRHEACTNEKCLSSDANAVYEDGSKYCFSCNVYTPSPDAPEYNKESARDKVRSVALKQETYVKDKGLKAAITKERALEIKEQTVFDKTGYRGITEATNKFFGVRYSYDEDDGIHTVYYPCTKDGELSGYKTREHPKEFSAEGATGNECDLFGAFRFQAGGKYVLITEGEHDALAGFQMLKEYNESRNSDFITAVVSITQGGANPAKQLANNYDFLNRFDQIILGFDADTVGQAAIDKAVSALPKGKVKVASWSKFKDPNKYLEEDASAVFIRDFYNAKPYVPTGVLASTELYDKILEQAIIEKVPLPPFLRKLQDMLGGGFILGHIYNLAAPTSIGKTAFVNELIYYWLFHSPHLVGVVSMELNAGQYGETLLSRHIQNKLARLSVEDKMNQLNSDAIKAKGHELFYDDDNQPRFFLIDDRDGSLENMQTVIEQMVISSGVKIVVIDPATDLVDGMSNEEQALFMKWCKSMVKSHGISFILIQHMRKTQGGTSSLEVKEDDIMGSSTIMKSSSANILLARDKMNPDPIVRNTTVVSLPKNRVTGETGPAGEVFYEFQTHTLHDAEEYWTINPRPAPVVTGGDEF